MNITSTVLGTCSQMLWVKNKATQRMLNVKVLRPLKHYIPLRDNDFRTKVMKDVPSSIQHINNEEGNIWNIKGNINSYVLLSTHFYFIIIELLADVKGIGVILHGLHLVPINRWTVTLYCSRWLGICFCVTLVLLPSFKPKVFFVTCYYFSLIIK